MRVRRHTGYVTRGNGRNGDGGKMADQKDEIIARLRKQVETAKIIVERGVELMTPQQIGRWHGVRAFLEQDEEDYTEAK